MQPESIRRFTLFYLGALVVSLAVTFIQYDSLVAQAERQMGAVGAGLGAAAAIVSVAVWTGIVLLLWYFVARKGLVIAKWIVVLLFLFNVVTSFGIAAGGLSLAESVSLASFLLQALAVYHLFRPDAKAWFAGERAAGAAPED